MNVIIVTVLCLLSEWVVIQWISWLYYNRQVIRDADGSPYLVRYFVWKPKGKNLGRIYLHHIIRSDHDRALHSHPWVFRSFILKGGYREITTVEDVVNNEWYPRHAIWKVLNSSDDSVYHDFKAPCYLKRPAEWRHRLELPAGKSTWTLVFIGPKTNEWGFFPNGKFCHWTKYDTSTGLCEEN